MLLQTVTMTCTHVGFSLQASADMFVLVCSRDLIITLQGGGKAMAFSLRRGPWQKGFNCELCDFKSEVGFGLLNHHISKHSERLADRQHKCLKCGKTFSREVMMSFQFFKNLKNECNEIQTVPLNQSKAHVTSSIKQLLSNF